MKLPATLALLMGLVPLALPAQTIYRCGSNEYTRVPCADGRPVEALDTRSAAQRAEARRILAEEEKLGKELEHDRVRQEAALKPAVASSTRAPAPAPAASAAKKTTPKKKRHKPELDPDRDFLAAVPAAAKQPSTPR